MLSIKSAFQSKLFRPVVVVWMAGWLLVVSDHAHLRSCQTSDPCTGYGFHDEIIVEAAKKAWDRIRTLCRNQSTRIVVHFIT